MSDGIDSTNTQEALPPARRKSAGLAFLFSALLPGAGQFYCGNRGRAGTVFGFWLLGLILLPSKQVNVRGIGIFLIFVLWIFSFLDSYFTAKEMNTGKEIPVGVQSPRVATTLNLLTAGFGYFYLGERGKGTIIFAGTQILRLAGPRLSGFTGGTISLALIVLQMMTAADAYRIARMQLKEAMVPEPVSPEVNSTESSHLPVFVPVGLAALASLIFFAMMIYGLALRAGRGANASSRRAASLVGGPGSRSRPNSSRLESTPLSPPTDLASAVSNVQLSELRGEEKEYDLPTLRLDTKIFTSTLQSRDASPDDVAVAHYFRAEALAIINAVHKYDGEQIEPDATRMALADYDFVIAANPHTYVPVVMASNAEYSAGFVARNYLHSTADAYKYWNHCAQEGHAGCLNIMANAHLTGDGGQKVNVNEAINLHTMVFNTGTRFHCAGALSALGIAEIIYFYRVPRAGSDELVWVKKSYDLMDRVEAQSHIKNACGRAEAEIEEFLFRESRGQAIPSLLAEAEDYLGDEASPLKTKIGLFSGIISNQEFEYGVQSEKSGKTRCASYFDAMWYEHLLKKDAIADRYRQRLREIGDFDCGLELAYARQMIH